MISGVTGSPPNESRVAGYLEALEVAGLVADPSLIVPGGFDEDSGYQAMADLLATKRPPTAVAAINDVVAIGALRAAHDAGLRVPEDVAVCGFDDVPSASVVRPALTTIDHRAREVGRAAGRLLLSRLAAPDQAQQITQVQTRLQVRDSA
jgi:LacI family transcriptional regulator